MDVSTCGCSDALIPCVPGWCLDLLFATVQLRAPPVSHVLCVWTHVGAGVYGSARGAREAVIFYVIQREEECRVDEARLSRHTTELGYVHPPSRHAAVCSVRCPPSGALWMTPRWLLTIGSVKYETSCCTPVPAANKMFAMSFL
ncbi:hypothetical protein CBL_09424 [Carabus blaptoides fortunei]